MENSNLVFDQRLIGAAQKFNIEPENIQHEISNKYKELPTFTRVINLLREFNETKTIQDEFNELVICPAGENAKGEAIEAIRFKHPKWKFKLKGMSDNRQINFEGLPPTLSFDCKVISLYVIWLANKIAKLSSLTRQCADLVSIAKTADNIGILSMFHLGQQMVCDKLFDELRKTKKENSLRNTVISLNNMADMSNTAFKDYGFSVDKYFNDELGETEPNQTYCMPFPIMSKLWLSLHDYFTGMAKSTYISDVRSIIQMYTAFDGKMTSTASNEWLIHIDGNQEVLKRFHDNWPEQGTWTEKDSDESLLKYRVDMPQFFHAISDVFQTGRGAIIAFTGMRISEGVAVHFNSLIQDDINGYVGVKSILSKYATDGGIDELWAAAPWVVDVFEFVRALAKVVFKKKYVKDIDIMKMNVCTNVRDYWYGEETNVITSRSFTKWSRTWCDKHDLVLTKDNIVEFNQLNPNLAHPEVTEKEIHEGAVWPLKSHQARRSIATHAKRLGVASQQVLSFQLKHISRTETEWYSGNGNVKTLYRADVPKVIKEAYEAESAKLSAETALDYQERSSLFGKGGKKLEDSNQASGSAKIYPSLKKATNMAKRKQSTLMSLGNGMFCLNGQDCKMTSIVQSSKCDPQCENLLAAPDAIARWKQMYEHYSNLIDNSIEHSKSAPQIEYFNLEREYYKKALEYYGEL